MRSNDKTKTEQGEICPRQWGHADLLGRRGCSDRTRYCKANAKISKCYFTRLPRWLFSVLIIHLIRLARELPPRDPSSWASDIISFHPHTGPMRPAGGETWGPERWGLAQGHTTSKRQRWDPNADGSCSRAYSRSISPLVQFNLWIVDMGLRSWARCCLCPPHQTSGCLARQSFQIPSESKASCLHRFQPLWNEEHQQKGKPDRWPKLIGTLATFQLQINLIVADALTLNFWDSQLTVWDTPE